MIRRGHVFRKRSALKSYRRAVRKLLIVSSILLLNHISKRKKGKILPTQPSRISADRGVTDIFLILFISLLVLGGIGLLSLSERRGLSGAQVAETTVHQPISFGADARFSQGVNRHISTVVSSCQTINVPGSYELNQGLSSAGSCIDINQSNVTLDCAGFTINYSSTFAGNGIFTPNNINNVTIKNCRVVQIKSFSGAEAIFFGVVSDSIIINNTAIANDSAAIELVSARNNLIANNIILQSADGAALAIISSTNNTIVNNTVIANSTAEVSGAIQVEASSNNQLLNNNATSNASYAISLGGSVGSSNNLLVNNIAHSVTSKGIRAASLLNSTLNNTLINNTGTSNTSNGISIDSGANNNVLINNTGTSNTGSGIALTSNSQNNTLEGNIGTSPNGSGIKLDASSFNNLTNNTGSSSSSNGILVSASTNNVLVNNVAISAFEGAIYFTADANNNSMLGNQFASNTAGAIEFGSNGGNFNNFTNTTLETNESWIKVEDLPTSNNSYTNTLFNAPDGSIRVLGLFMPPSGLITIDLTNLLITFNRSFINTTNVSFLNQSAQITLHGITFINPGPVEDPNDADIFSECTIPQCVIQSYNGSTFVFNVTHFTIYAASEAGVIDILVSKNGTPNPVLAGSLLTYTIVLNNTGTGTGLDVLVVDSYPAGVSFVTSSPSPTSGNNTFALGNLLADSSTTVNITVSVGSNLSNGTLLNNTVSVTFTNNTGQNTTLVASTSTTVITPPAPVVSGGGGGGGNNFMVPAKIERTQPKTCFENWACAPWGSCVNGKQTRGCIDNNKCQTTILKPLTEQPCGSVQPKLEEPASIVQPVPKPVNPAAVPSPVGQAVSAAGALLGVSAANNSLTFVFYVIAIASLLGISIYIYHKRHLHTPPPSQ